MTTLRQRLATIDRRDAIVVAGGLATTALAFAIVWLAASTGAYPMAFYVLVSGIIPVPAGAVGIGLIASLGYGAGSYYTQRKMSGHLLASILELLVASYAVAVYLDYRFATADLGDAAVGFLAYVDQTTRSMTWSSDALGPLGYGLRALELSGFVGGGLIVPALLRRKPYCDRCRCYRHSKFVAIVPAADDENGAHVHLEAIMAAARGGVFEEIAQAIGTHGPIASRRVAEDSNGWLSVSLVHCPNCADGALVAKAHIRPPQAKRHVKVVSLGSVALDADLVSRFVAPPHRDSQHPYR